MKWAFLFKFIFCGMMLELRMFQKVFFTIFFGKLLGLKKIQNGIFLEFLWGCCSNSNIFKEDFFRICCGIF